MTTFIEYQRFGVVTRTLISDFSKQSFPSYPKIHYRTLVESLVGQDINSDDKGSNHFVPEATSHDTSVDTSVKQKKSSSGYENIIERLEKKYCGSYDPSADSDSDEAHEENPRPKKRKARAQADYYDMDDGFIDDSDNIAAIESAQHSKRLQTKYDGYFVSSGELEVSDGPARDSRKEVEVVREAEGPIGESVPTPNASVASVVKHMSSGDTAEAAALTPPKKSEKPEKNTKEWAPPPSVASAMEQFTTAAQDLIQSKGGTALKSFPVVLDPALDTLDAEVTVSMSSGKLSNIYLSAVRSALGGEVSAAVVKSAIIRLRSGRDAGRLVEELRNEVEALGNRLREQVTECPPSAALVTATKEEGDANGNTVSSDHPQVEVAPDPEDSSVGDVTTEAAVAPPPSTPVVEWKWVCKWTPQLRGEVCDLEQLCLRWVERENTHRSHLKAAHKKSMEESETVPLSGNAEVTRVLQAVADIAFGPPYDPGAVDKGGFVGVKKALATEKTR
jgi:hypothetical protein